MPRPDVFNKETHAAMLLEQIVIDFPEVKNKDFLVEFIIFMMNKSFWEGVDRLKPPIMKQ